jgi:tRNA nucleotidyltransferase/poly(A) polymerase
MISPKWLTNPSYNSSVQVIKSLQDAGFIAVFAGGCVRDTALSLEPKDYDIATSAVVSDILGIFPDSVQVGKAFGVYLINGHEVASLRTEDSYFDGRHPSNVQFVQSLEEDSKRRDFTINAMYYDPIANNTFDFHDGYCDIAARKIKFVGSPDERIKEDHLRILRAIRFAMRFDYRLDDKAFEAIQKNAALILKTAQERVGIEIGKIFKQVSKDRGLLLDYMLPTGLLLTLLPEVSAMVGCEQPKQFHPEGDVYAHTKCVMNNLPEDASEELCWAAMLHDVGKPPSKSWDEEDKRWRFNRHEQWSEKMAKVILERFRYSNDFIDQVRSLVDNHMAFQHVRRMKESKLKRFLSISNFSDHLALHRADCLGSHGDLDHYEFCQKKLAEFANEAPVLKLPDRLVTGHDLIAMGMSAGPAMKPMLEKAFDMQLEGKTREEILKELVG